MPSKSWCEWVAAMAFILAEAGRGVRLRMRMMFLGVMLAGAGSLVAQAPAAAELQKEKMAAAESSIDGEKVRAHVKFLADDLLEGRGPGLRGAEIAAQYIATQ